jgi:phosphomevalonate kinase
MKIEVFGKLYVAGEYAIVSVQSPALLLKTPQGMTLTVDAAPRNAFHSSQVGTLHWDWTDLTPLHAHPYLLQALDVAHRYLSELKLPIANIAITVQSDLDSPRHQKYGFGSSGALTVGVIEAVLAHHGQHVAGERLYRLAVIAQAALGRETSYGDLACSAMKQAVYYERFTPSWQAKLTELSLIELLTEPWPGCVLAPLGPLKHPCLAVYTNTSADSHALVTAMRAHQDSPAFQSYLSALHRELPELKATWSSTHSSAFMASLGRLQDALSALAEATGIALVIPAMATIDALVRPLKGRMKLSGAGGGDCVLCVFEEPQSLVQARRVLHAAGFETLLISEDLR